ncbi:helix-turn-helix transcriptional regulator [Streptomyces zingiberis]|uniref:Helix-turn-helix domain-containing protein n=1 Tax=Streptomyces zingiberis TaxID=2053010 RepID=A0ABX1BZN4_9ACTN|nr:LuxR family transcriptional regulator [Streptomyces zingiberis]NJQ02588.1 helix-turn-helix domain-containing protein [Streptomyces zingiberis]
MDLVDRGEELSLMEDMLTAGAAGRGGVLLVSGPVAVGKTALLRAFGERAAAAGALLLQATASGAEQELPLGVMGQLLLRAELRVEEARRVTRLLDLVTARAVSAPAGVTAPPAVGNALPQLCRPLLEKMRERLVLISVDDVHHADPHSLECVLHIARRADSGRILLLLGENSAFPSGNTRLRVELLRLPRCREIRLGPLGRHGVAALMSASGAAGWRTRPSVAELHRLGGGNPLLTRALIEDCRFTGAAGEPGPGGGPAGPVPGRAFEGAVATLLYRGDRQTRDAAWALAVLGPREAGVELTAEVLGRGRDSVRRGLGALHEAGLLDGAGRFRHDACRAAVLAGIEPVHRAGLEARAARVLHEHGAAATAVVPHLIAGEPVEDPWALPTLLEAAERALAGDEVEAALSCLRAARDSCADGRLALTIRAALTRAGWRVNPASAARYLPELTAAALDGRLGPRETDELVGHLLWFGRLNTALRVTRAAGRSGADHSGGPRGAGDLRCWPAYGYPGTPEGAGTRSGGAGGTRPRPVGPAHGTHHRAATLMRSLPRGGGADVVARAEQILQGTRLSDSTVPDLVTAVNALILTDRPDRASSWCQDLLREAAERRAPLWRALLLSASARIDLRLGRLPEAEEAAGAALGLVPPEGWGVAVAAPAATVVYARTAMGRLDEAAAQLAVPVPEAAFRTIDGLLYLRARGLHHLAAGRPYAALDDFRRCGRSMTRWDFDLPALVPWRTDAARAHLALGDTGRARALAEEQLALAGAGRGGTRGVTLCVLAGALGPRHRPPLLAEAVDLLRERGHRLELARAVEELARAHRELGEHGRARTLARKAQQLARECGVPATAPAPCAVAGAAGGATPGPGRHPRSGQTRHRVRLSEAELRVATLAARGHTNRQIADRLFITVSTVEQHLTRAYRKLQVRRRAELAAKLDPAAPADHREKHREERRGSTRDRLHTV